MVTYVEYLKNLLMQIVESYDIINNIEDKPGDLQHVKKELLKINGFLKVIANKVEVTKIPLSDFKPLKSKFRHYLETYYFEKEIDTMAPLYSNDTFRIKNMRLKIIEALDDRKMIESAKDLIEKL